MTQVYEGERLFDLVVRFLPEFRQDVEAISNILVSTPTGARIPLKQVATIKTADRRLHHLSGEQRTLYPYQIQRPRSRFGKHGRGSAEPDGEDRSASGTVSD